jgi:uncharacterized protein
LASRFNKFVVGVNNLIRGRKKRNLQSGKVMLLFSHCLQNSKCQQKIVNDLSNCKRCGKCVVKDILEISERYKVKCAIASGSEMALEKVYSQQIDGVIAIACEKELAGGILSLFPKVVFAVCNSCPNGPCKDCQIDINHIEKYLKKILKPI